MFAAACARAADSLTEDWGSTKSREKQLQWGWQVRERRLDFDVKEIAS